MIDYCWCDFCCGTAEPPEEPDERCPDPDCDGYVVKTGDLDPRGVYAVCSDRCGWSA